MDYMGYLKFFANDLAFSFVIILLTFILGWVMYSKAVLRGTSLKDALFEKDNLAGWIEFIGAFVFPTLYLAAKAIESPTSPNFFVDLLMSALYVVAYVVLFTVLRLISGVIVKSSAPKDLEGKINLNNEIYGQKNVSAALFSTSLSIIFVSMIRFLNFGSGQIYNSLLRISDILIFTLLSFLVYVLILRRKTSLMKEIFDDNNPAAGVGFLGFIFAVETILMNAVVLQTQFDLIELAVLSIISLIVFGILALLFTRIFAKIIKANICSEIYEQNNVGAALGQVAIYVGIALVIVGFVR